MIRKLVILIAVLMLAAIFTAPIAAQATYVSYTVTAADANGGLSSTRTAALWRLITLELWLRGQRPGTA